MRTCLGCGRRRPKLEMLRIVWSESGLKADYAGRLPGRGGYLCGDVNCMQRLGRGKFMAKPPGGCNDAFLWRQLITDIKRGE